MSNKKITIMKSRTQPTDEEIRQFMDFEGIKEKFHAQGGYAAGASKTIATILGLAGVATFLILTLPEMTEPVSGPTQEIVSQPTEPSRRSPIQTPDSTIVLEQKPPVTAPGLRPRPQRKADMEETVVTAQEPPQPAVYLEAEPVLGYPHLYEYFNRELRYPEPALRDSIEGILSLSFIINREGNPVQIRIEDSPGPLFDEEAMRLMQNMPSWKPATVNGTPVSARISLPITFQIRKVKAN